MNTDSGGALVRRKRVQRLIGMIILLCCVIAPFVASPLFKPASPDHAAGCVQINAGGAAVAGFIADTDFTGGTARTSTKAITTTGVTNPVPQAVYQSYHYGNFRYAI